MIPAQQPADGAPMVNRVVTAPSRKPPLRPAGHPRGWAMTLGLALLCLLVATQPGSQTGSEP